MKYENKEAFEQVNMFGTGTPNTAYSKFFHRRCVLKSSD